VSTGPVAIGPDQFGGLPPQGPLDPGGPTASTGRLTGASRAVMGDASLWAPVAVFALLVLFAIFAPIIWGQSPDAQNLLNSLASPSSTHPMGTDELGRDVFARVATGARISLLFALIVSLTGAVVGGIIGLVAGTMGGASDGVTMRFMDAILAFPPLILAMAVTVGLGVGVFTAGIGIALVSVPWYARVMRSEAIRIRSLPFIEAAYAMGATRSRIIRRHIVPHLLPVLFIQMAAAFGYAVLALAGLSFVGLGAQVPTPEWGAMITEGLSYALTGQWWVSVFPGIFLLITVTAANVLSDRLRDVLDPSANMARN
jgi:peptide/nickel transport system permease protein